MGGEEASSRVRGWKVWEGVGGKGWFFQNWIIIQFEGFLEMAPGCIGEHLHGEELVLPEMDYNPIRRVFRATPGTCFVVATSLLTRGHDPSCWQREH